jgi:alkanesulfonate monooxygenase SsuD/methylene tetrahydromethanopterin reductase-like flavin-dependent oxidoreductase (luciferase family)
MIGSIGERMLRIAAPHVDSWNAWYADTGNSPAGIAALRDKVDAACADVGRPASDIERTVAIHVRMPGGTGRTMGDTSGTQAVAPLEGSPEEMADELRAYAREGIAHVQLVLDPIDRVSIERFAPVLRLLESA